MIEVIDTGLLDQCYMLHKKHCDKRKPIKIKKGEHKGKFIYICMDGCCEDDKDCPYDK